MIYAVGPDYADLQSNAKDAGLRRHEEYGKFTINLQASRGETGQFPVDITKTDNATADGGTTDDHDFGSSAHAFIMAGVFVIIFPFGAAYLRLQSGVRWHWVMQAIGVLGTIIGIGIGLEISTMYNRVCAETLDHQKSKLTYISVQALQLGSPAYRTSGSGHYTGASDSGLSPPLDFVQKDTPSFITFKDPSQTRTYRHHSGYSERWDVSYKFLSSALAYTNAHCSGFAFALAPRSRILGYGLIIAFVAALIALVFMLKLRRDRRRAPYQTAAAQNFQSAYVPPQHQNDIPLGSAEPAPPYSPSRPLYP